MLCLNSTLSSLFTLVTRRPYCPGKPKELCFTTLSLANETMGMRPSVVKQSFFGPPGQYGRLVTRANYASSFLNFCLYLLDMSRTRQVRQGFLFFCDFSPLNGSISLFSISTVNNRPPDEAPGNEPLKDCILLISPEPRAKLHCLQLKFKIS